MARRTVGFLITILALTAAGCGGSGGEGGDPRPPLIPAVSWKPGVHQPASSLAGFCAKPRNRKDPWGRPWPDRPGSAATENNFLRSWTNELYLWYQEAPDVDPNSTADVLAYFDLLRTSEKTPSGRDKDNFHFTYDTDEYIALAQSGESAGYGLEWVVLAGLPPRRIVLAYTEPGSPAAAQNLERGMEVLSVDGVDAVNGGAQAVIAGLYPRKSGEQHTFTLKAVNGTQRTVTMKSAVVTAAPVQSVKTIPTELGPVGYLLFNDHIATSEAALANAITSLRNLGVEDLILDIRYNGGGYLDIASSLAYMIAGEHTAGRSFERMVFNDKHPSTDPVTGEPLTPIPFHKVGGFGATKGVALPTLNLPRVYVLTGANTCSASESIMNGLRGAGIDVYQFGSTTCGKPYGFYPQDNCGTTYFSIQFQNVNEQGFGDYPDGFSPANTGALAEVKLPGCSVRDDFSRPLGDPNEARLSAALAFRGAGNDASACPAASGFAPGAQLKPGAAPASEGLMFKSPVRENRILRGRL